MLKSLRFNSVPTSDQLRKWNIWLAVLYGLQAVAVLVVGSTQLAPLTTSFLTVDSLRSTTSGSLVLAPATHHLFDLNLLYVAFAVMAILAAAYASQATWLRTRYEVGLKQNFNATRWAGYGLTASLLFVVLAILVGVTDLTTLLVLLVLGIVLHVLCWWAERNHGQRGKVKSDAWISYGLAALAGAGMWLVVAIYLVGDNVFGAGHIPVRVYWLALTAAVTCLSFALGLGRQLQNPKTGNRYRLTEQRYMLLTLLTTSLLVWQIVAGTMH
jgi:hypothetical protein